MRQMLKARYQNPNIRHRLDQIAMDGSQKLPPRILDPLFENLGAGRSIDGLLDVVAAWMRFVERAATQQRPLADPLARQPATAAVTLAGGLKLWLPACWPSSRSSQLTGSMPSPLP